MNYHSLKGFTLIELLIVVAIIAILAAIAVPNFLEAQVRSKVSRAHADMRSIATALESYRVDNPGYPPGFYTWSGTGLDPLWRLTTPVAHITSIPKDPFFFMETYSAIVGPGPYWYWQIPKIDPNFGESGYWMHKAWRLASAGPDTKHGQGSINGDAVYELNWIDYDSTNGTVSRGEIMRWGP